MYRDEKGMGERNPMMAVQDQNTAFDLKRRGGPLPIGYASAYIGYPYSYSLQ